MPNEEWILRYVQEVGRLAPVELREQAEVAARRQVDEALRSAGIEELAAADEGAVLAVLQQLGCPERLVARYAPRYLVGPELYPVFRTVLWIVMLIMVGLSFFGAAVSIGLHGAPLQIGMILGNLASGMLQTLGLVVLVFGLIEYFSHRGEPQARATWNPQRLPHAGDLDAAKRGGLVTDICFTVVALVTFNLLLTADGAIVLYNGVWQRVPVFSQAFLGFVPIFTLLWVAEVVLKTYVLTRGRWSVPTRALEAILSLSGIAILLRMLTTPLLTTSPTFDPLLKLALALAIAVAAVDVMMQGFRLYGQYQREHTPPMQGHPVG